MAWIPGIREGEARDRFKVVVGARIDFLTVFAGRAETLLNEPEHAALAAGEALTEAASLAFASNDNAAGKQHAAHALERLKALPPERRSVPRIALLEGLFGISAIRLDPDGISADPPSLLTRSAWPEATALAETAGALLAAALSRPQENSLMVLEEAQVESLPFHAIGTSAEAGTLAAFGYARFWRGEAMRDPGRAANQEPEARAAFGALHQRYASRLRLLAPTTSGWWARRPHAELIDWPLLILHIGLRRMRGPTVSYAATGDGPGAFAGRFVEELAEQLAGERYSQA